MARYRNLQARLKADQFKADEAKLNLSYTQITAPEDGSIAKKSVEPGMVIPPGQALFGFVSSQERWITANFKETQLSSIKPGQKVAVEVDAVTGKKFEGVVDSIGSATGSTFTLLPPDNSTGNFTKGGPAYPGQDQASVPLPPGYRSAPGGTIRRGGREDPLKRITTRVGTSI